jgi:uncharacterized protein YqgC (DUF456 family)
VNASTLDLVIAAAMLVGLAGTVVPFLPGLPIIVVAALVWVVADGADPGRWAVFAVVTAIAIAGIAIGSALPARRASRAGASRWIVVAGAIGLVLGAITIPLIGALIGWPLGVFAASWLTTRDLGRAWAMTRATIAGVGLGTAVQFGAGVLAVGTWAVAAWRW